MYCFWLQTLSGCLVMLQLALLLSIIEICPRFFLLFIRARVRLLGEKIQIPVHNGTVTSPCVHTYVWTKVGSFTFYHDTNLHTGVGARAGCPKMYNNGILLILNWSFLGVNLLKGHWDPPLSPWKPETNLPYENYSPVLRSKKILITRGRDFKVEKATELNLIIFFSSTTSA